MTAAEKKELRRALLACKRRSGGDGGVQNTAAFVHLVDLPTFWAWLLDMLERDE